MIKLKTIQNLGLTRLKNATIPISDWLSSESFLNWFNCGKTKWSYLNIFYLQRAAIQHAMQTY